MRSQIRVDEASQVCSLMTFINIMLQTSLMGPLPETLPHEAEALHMHVV